MTTDLKSLRASIRETDEKLLDLMKKRIDLAKEVGKFKFKNDLPIKNFKVEKEVIEKSRSYAKKINLYENLAEETSKLLIRYAVAAQEEFHSETKRRQSTSEQQSVAIIGGQGKMGQWLVNYFNSFGHDVKAIDQGDDWSELKETNIIVLSTPISLTSDAIDEIIKLKPSGLIFDICSLKTPIIPAINRAKREGLRISSAHPMFGPETDLLSGQNIIVCDVGDEKDTKQVENLFKETTANLVTMPLAKHDELMSYVLGMSHLVNLAFAKVLSESGIEYKELCDVASSTFDAQLKVVEPVVCENQDLYYEIQSENQFSKEMIEQFMGAINSYYDSVTQSDRGLFKEFMEQSRVYMS